LRELPEAPEYFYGIINMRGEIIPAINFKSIFGFQGFDFATDKDVIICKVEEQIFGLVVDKVIKVMDYEKSEIKPPPRLTDKIQAAFVKGVIKTENDFISLIDIFALFTNKNQNFLSYESFKKGIFQSSLVEHYFDKKTREYLDSIFNEIGFAFNNITRKPVLNYIVKTSIKKEKSIQKVIEAVKNKTNSLVPVYLFHPNTNNLIFYHDKDFLTLQKLIKHVILPTKREKQENDLNIWVLNKDSSMDAYSLLFILCILLEDEFDMEFSVTSSGSSLEKLNEAANAEFNSKQLVRLTHSVKQYLFENVNPEKELEEQEKEKTKKTYKLRNEWKNKIFFDLFFPSSKFGKKDMDLIYAPDFFANLPEKQRIINLERLYKSLRPGGILLCGYFEDLSKLPHKFKGFMIGNRAYFKKE
jgi:purine-binding chemotaxis protein CheW